MELNPQPFKIICCTCLFNDILKNLYIAATLMFEEEYSACGGPAVSV